MTASILSNIDSFMYSTNTKKVYVNSNTLHRFQSLKSMNYRMYLKINVNHITFENSTGSLYPICGRSKLCLIN